MGSAKPAAKSVGWSGQVLMSRKEEAQRGMAQETPRPRSWPRRVAGGAPGQAIDQVGAADGVRGRRAGHSKSHGNRDGPATRHAGRAEPRLNARPAEWPG